MRMPTETEILSAAKDCPEAQKVLRRLFPDVFCKVLIGQMYNWKTEKDDMSCSHFGVLVGGHPAMGGSIFLVVPTTGEVVLELESGYQTRSMLEKSLGYKVNGPYQYKSWTTKPL